MEQMFNSFFRYDISDLAHMVYSVRGGRDGIYQ
jgi:hypothetical protein